MSIFDSDQSCFKHLSSKNQEVMKILDDKVEHVYRFRDRYFETHSLENAIHKNSDVEKLLLEALKEFKLHEVIALETSKAKYYYLKGRLLNVVSNYNKEAEDLLSKAIKLDRKSVEAWNELGECYWKNDEIQKAKNCFEGALKEAKNKRSLRSLSTLARQEVPTSRKDCINNIEKGLSYAKEAVNLDPQDGLSWSVLGNAHLSHFFGVQQHPKTLKQCLSAYMQAEKDVVARGTPDLYYNKGITLRYNEDYSLALESFNQACLNDPTWEPPQVKEKQLILYLDQIKDLLATNGKMKPKRFKQLLRSIECKQLGPYSGGSYTSSQGGTVKLIETSLLKLEQGLNEEKVILGKVVCSVRNEDTIPFTFCLTDKEGTCVVVTIFNLAEGKGVIIGDSVAIPEPFVTDIDFKYKEHEYKFRMIRVETPILLVVNGKKLSKEQQAGAHFSIFKKFD